MVLNHICLSFLIITSVLGIACNRTISPPNMLLAKEALQEYCKGEKIEPGSFNDAHVYREKKYDWCVEFITKTNIPQKHVLLLYFKNQRIVERHRILGPDDLPNPHSPLFQGGDGR
jgi:hypothetical protein